MDRGTRRSESSQTGIKVLTLLVTLALISVQLYRALTAGAVGDTTSLRNFTIALILLGGIGVYYSSYGQPVVFLVGAIFVGTLTVFWGLRAPVTVTLETSRLVLGGRYSSYASTSSSGTNFRPHRPKVNLTPTEPD